MSSHPKRKGDVYGSEYHEILANSSKCLVLLNRTLRLLAVQGVPIVSIVVAFLLLSGLSFKREYRWSFGFRI